MNQPNPLQPADRNFLLGVLALQIDFISREQLTDAASTWLRDKSRLLDDILVDNGAISEADRQLLVPLVQQHIARHQGDPTRSLASLRTVEGVGDDLFRLADEQITAAFSQAGFDPSSFSVSPTVLPGSVPARFAPAPSPAAPVNRFQIIRPYAKGGLGEVSIAKDLELHRDVAFKEIQAKFADDPESRSRFLLEAEITGGLEHPGIVPVYGLGSDADGRPYYAMRFIKGDSLQQAADGLHGKSTSTQGEPNLRPSIQEPVPIDFGGVEFRKLLGRFIDVCQAIEYAHSRGVLHRDLKPSNVMLGKFGETLVVDWGLAKTQVQDSAACSEPPLQPVLSQGSTETLVGSVMGTPAFMPPEQATGRLDELGPASDVYSLGATLFYLLTGCPAFTGKDLRSVLQNVARGKFSSPRDVRPGVPKALNAICCKAMALAPGDRFQSPAEMADELERYLADEPVRCYAEPWNDRVRRWSRKHPRTMATVATTLLVGLTGLGLASVVVGGMNRELAKSNRALSVANHQEREARQQETLRRQEAEDARKQESIARQKAETVSRYLSRVFRSADPNRDGKTIAVFELLEPAAVELMNTNDDDQPELHGNLLQAIGMTYLGLGLHRQATPLIERARDLFEQHLGQNASDTLEATNNLGIAYSDAGNLEGAVAVLEDARTRAYEHLGAGDPTTISILGNLAGTLNQAGQTKKALLAAQETLELARNHLRPDDELQWTSLNNISVILATLGQSTEALKLQQQVADSVRQTLGPDAFKSLEASNNLGSAHINVYQYETAIEILEDTLTRATALLGETHPFVTTVVNNLASAYSDSGQFEKSIALYENATLVAAETLGRDHQVTLTMLGNMAIDLGQTGQHERGIMMLEDVRQRALESLPPDHWMHTQLEVDLAALLLSSGDLARGIAQLESALPRLREERGSDHPNTRAAMQNLVIAYRNTHQPKKAWPLLETLFAIPDLHWPNENDRLRATADWLEGRLQSEQFEGLTELATQAIADSRRIMGEDHPTTELLMQTLAEIHAALGHREQAIELGREIVRLTEQRFGEHDPNTLISISNLAQLFHTLGDKEESARMTEQVYRLSIELSGPKDEQTLILAYNTGDGYATLGNLEKAIPFFEEAAIGMRESQGASHPLAERFTQTLIVAYRRAERFAEAANWATQEINRLEASESNPELLSYHLSGLGRQQFQQGDYPAAEKTLRHVLSMRPSRVDNETLWLFAQTDLGLTLAKQNRLSEAEPELLAIVEGFRRLRKTNPNLATSTLRDVYTWLDTCSRAKKTVEDYRAAREWLKAHHDLRVELATNELQAATEQSGEGTLETSVPLRNLALAYRASGDQDKAIRCFEQSLEIRRGLPTPQDPELLRVLHEMGRCLVEAQRINEAIDLLQESVEGHREHFGADDHRTLSSLRQLAEAHEQAGELDTARTLFHQGIEGRRRDDSELLPLAEDLARLAAFELEHGQATVAEPLARECLQIRLAQNKESWDVASAQALLGASLRLQGKLDEAEPLLLAGFEGMARWVIRRPHRYEQRVIETLEHLVGLYEALEQADDVQSWQAILEERRAWVAELQLP